jgi:UDP-glucose:(heptosyl)LPS alpha-1,3-glucosyltransferase
VSPIAIPRPPVLGPRVALVRGRYDPAGGAERFVQAAIAALKAEGASLTLVTRRWPESDGNAIVVDPFHLGSLWRDWGFARAACAALATRPFDLVQSHERIACCDVYRAGDGVHAEWLAQRSRVQGAAARLATRLNPHHRYLLGAERALFSSPRLKAVICNSLLVARQIAGRFPAASGKTRLIRNAVDSDAHHPRVREGRDAIRQQLGIPREAQVVLHVGSGFERKGVAQLLDAAARAPGDPWVLVVGKDKQAREYTNLAARLAIAPRVRFAGAVSDVRPYYGAADVFVLATLYDPQPNAALEAMACGLPVVTTTQCGAAELIEEGRSGFVRDALDTAGLAAAIGSLRGDAALRAGEAAREAVAPYTPRAMAREYLELYRSLLRR